MKQARKKVAHRKRRIIVNNDGDDCWSSSPDNEPKTIENFLSKRTSPLVGSHVDAIFYCTGVFNLYTHKSTESELIKKFELIVHMPGGEIIRGQWNWASELTSQVGKDPLEIMVEFCHQHNMEIFWSMRMNDTHDAVLTPSIRSQWKKEHPHCLMGKPGQSFTYGCGDRWSTLDYGIEEVRDKVFRILKDVCIRYDIDGIELDFFRHPVYFKPHVIGEPVTQEHCDMMTALLRRVRDMTEEIGKKRKRSLLVAVRVPDSVGYAKAIGLDIVKWMEEDIIDILIGSGYFHLEPWENLVSLGKHYDIPVYACLSGSRLVSGSQPTLKGNIEIWRGEALKAWEAGVSGIYTFNRFEPQDPIFHELGDPNLLKRLKHTYNHNPGIAEFKYWCPKGAEKFLNLK